MVCKNEFDFLIVGGGITGSAAALTFRRQGFEVGIVERTDLRSLKPGESLAPECKRFLKHIQFTPDDRSSLEYTGVSSVWGTDEPSISDFIFNPFGNGMIVDRTKLEIDLIKAAEGADIECFLNTSVLSCKREKDRWLVPIGRPGTPEILLTTRYMIFATGRAGRASVQPNPRRAYFDRLIGLSCVVRDLTTSPSKLLWVESLPTGWLYTNSLPAGRRVVTVFTEADLIPTGGSRKRFFRDAVRSSRWVSDNSDGAPATKTDARIYGFDARTQYLRNHIGQGWVNLGDAVHSIDPLSGLGIKKNLDMIEYLTPSISRLIEGDREAEQDFIEYNQATFIRFLAERDATYSRETRWRRSPFWQRRHANRTAVSN